MIRNYVLVGVGGFLGAIARYAVSLGVARYWNRELPLATFFINVTGSGVLGFFATYATATTKAPQTSIVFSQRNGRAVDARETRQRLPLSSQWGVARIALE